MAGHHPNQKLHPSCGHSSTCNLNCRLPVQAGVFFEAAASSFLLRYVDSCWNLHTRDFRASYASSPSAGQSSGGLVWTPSWNILLTIVPLQPVRFPAGPWRKPSLDIIGEFVAAPSCDRYMIVAIDYYSKWPEVATCSSATSGAVIEFLNHLFDRFGLIEEMVTDNGTNTIQFY